MIELMVSDGLQVMTLRVITSVSGTSSAAAPCAASSLHDVALGHNADHALVGAGHHQRADAPLGQNLGSQPLRWRWARW